MIVIDEITPELNSVLGQLSMNTDILEFSAYVSNGKRVFRYTPFHEDIIASVADVATRQTDPAGFNTIVVPARKEGFKRVFLGENRWYAIRISSAMLEKLEYVAAYQVDPISAITYLAKVDRIEKYLDTGKHVIIFDGPAEKIDNIPMIDGEKNLAPQGHRYTTIDVLQSASSLVDLWG